jgi:hypothetical protein
LQGESTSLLEMVEKPHLVQARFERLENVARQVAKNEIKGYVLYRRTKCSNNMIGKNIQ